MSFDHSFLNNETATQTTQSLFSQMILNDYAIMLYIFETGASSLSQIWNCTRTLKRLWCSIGAKSVAEHA